MCYVPKKDESKTNVSGKFIDDGSAVHKVGGCIVLELRERPKLLIET